MKERRKVKEISNQEKIKLQLLKLDTVSMQGEEMRETQVKTMVDMAAIPILDMPIPLNRPTQEELKRIIIKLTSQ